MQPAPASSASSASPPAASPAAHPATPSAGPTRPWGPPAPLPPAPPSFAAPSPALALVIRIHNGGAFASPAYCPPLSGMRAA